MRDHGGDLDRAMRAYGDGNWLDLSTGINGCPYPVGSLPERAWHALPTATEITALETQAAQTYRTDAALCALAGAQAAIQLVPRLRRPGRACVVGPTYNEHAAALISQGWEVTQVTDPGEAVGADVLTLVSPNNPDGRVWSPQDVLALRGQVGLLVVDESFADSEDGTSVAPYLTTEDIDLVVLRSFGKFYGLAGLRLGFALSGTTIVDQMRALAGPWAVSGPAIAVAEQALADGAWQEATRARLAVDAQRLDALVAQAEWRFVGGTGLFRTYEVPDAATVQDALARHHIWTRVFPYSDRWIRLGLPGAAAGWAQLEGALRTL